MSRHGVKIVIVVGTLAILGILSVQLYFIRHSYRQENKQLDQTIRVALQQVAEKLFDYHESSMPYDNIIHQYSSNYYVVNINNIIDVEILEFYLTKEFESRNLHLDFEYAIYDCFTDKMVYGNYVNLSEENKNALADTTQFPKYDEYIYYFGIYFPHKERYLLNSLSVWYFISAILIVVVLFFVYSMFIILRQKRMSEIQKDFIHNITHEFKTPLTTINLSTEVLSEKDILQEPDRLSRYVGIIREQASHLHEQVLKVLNSSATENLRPSLKLTNIHINDIVQDIVNSFEARFAKEDAEVHLEQEGDPILLAADIPHFKNVVINLIDNALKYSEPPKKINLHLLHNETTATLSVQDNGIGIEKKFVGRVFDKFFRVPTGNIHNVKGFGLGLSYVKNVVKAHRWKIKLHSEKGKGTVVTIKF